MEFRTLVHEQIRELHPLVYSVYHPLSSTSWTSHPRIVFRIQHSHHQSLYIHYSLRLYNFHVFPIIEQLKPSKRGELEVSEINDWYVRHGKISHTILSGFWSDLGTPQSMLYATNYIKNFQVKF